MENIVEYACRRCKSSTNISATTSIWNARDFCIAQFGKSTHCLSSSSPDVLLAQHNPDWHRVSLSMLYRLYMMY